LHHCGDATLLAHAPLVESVTDESKSELTEHGSNDDCSLNHLHPPNHPEPKNEAADQAALGVDFAIKNFHDSSTEVDTNNGTEVPSLSKNQLKKKRRWEKAMEVKKRRKLQEKQVKIERAKALGRDLDAERARQELARQNGVHRWERQREWQKKMQPGIQQSFQVCIDCSFESLMTAKEINSLALQIRYCYSTNKRSPRPIQLTATSLEQATLDHLHRVNGFEEWSNWAFAVTANSLEDYFQNRKEDLVYLTSDSETTLTTLDSNKVYVIGGLVDRNRYKRITIDRATALGIATARLPLDEHLSAMASTRVLTTNHVFALLLKHREHNGCWKKALAEVLPHRKEATFVE
jgi:tRNA (guanine9-N1)-methyltransferase